MAPHGRQKGNALAVLDAIARLAALAQCACCHDAMQKCKMLGLPLQISQTGGIVLQQQ